MAAGTSATFSVTTEKPAKEGQYQFLGWSYARNTSDTPDLANVIAPGAEVSCVLEESNRNTYYWVLRNGKERGNFAPVKEQRAVFDHVSPVG